MKWTEFLQYSLGVKPDKPFNNNILANKFSFMQNFKGKIKKLRNFNVTCGKNSGGRQVC